MAQNEETEGASAWEQLRYASQSDSAELAEQALAKLQDEVNRLDGTGLAALHHAVKGPSPEVLELLLQHDECDVDIPDRLDGNTPLHYAVKLSHPDARKWVIEQLLEAGADTRIANKHKEKAVDFLARDDPLREDFKQAEAEAEIDMSDVARDDDDSEEAGGESGEE